MACKIHKALADLKMCLDQHLKARISVDKCALAASSEEAEQAIRARLGVGYLSKHSTKVGPVGRRGYIKGPGAGPPNSFPSCSSLIMLDRKKYWPNE